MSASETSSDVTGIETTVPDDVPVESEDRRLGSLRIHIAHAEPRSRTGVLLYPPIFGLDAAMRACARAFAASGLTAVVWDPYDGEDGNGVVPDMLAKSKELQDPQMVADLTRIVDHLQDDLGLASVAGIGWCFGGRIGILHAGSDSRVHALSAYNPTIWSPTPVDVEDLPVQISRDMFPGQTLDEFDLAAAIRGPVQVPRPGHDLTHPKEYQQLMDILYSRPDPTFYEYYPDAHHGFSYTPGTANVKAHRMAWSNTLSLFAALELAMAPG